MQAIPKRTAVVVPRITGLLKRPRIGLFSSDILTTSFGKFNITY
jgi:hypothetical protein